MPSCETVARTSTVCGGLTAEAAEHEVAEAVDDEPAVVRLHAVEQMRMVGEDDVGAGVDGGLALARTRARTGARLYSKFQCQPTTT